MRTAALTAGDLPGLCKEKNRGGGGDEGDGDDDPTANGGPRAPARRRTPARRTPPATVGTPTVDASSSWAGRASGGPTVDAARALGRGVCVGGGRPPTATHGAGSGGGLLSTGALRASHKFTNRSRPPTTLSTSSVSPRPGRPPPPAARGGGGGTWSPSAAACARAPRRRARRFLTPPRVPLIGPSPTPNPAHPSVGWRLAWSPLSSLKRQPSLPVARLPFAQAPPTAMTRTMSARLFGARFVLFVPGGESVYCRFEGRRPPPPFSVVLTALVAARATFAVRFFGRERERWAAVAKKHPPRHAARVVDTTCRVRRAARLRHTHTPLRPASPSLSPSTRPTSPPSCRPTPPWPSWPRARPLALAPRPSRRWSTRPSSTRRPAWTRWPARPRRRPAPALARSRASRLLSSSPTRRLTPWTTCRPGGRRPTCRARRACCRTASSSSAPTATRACALPRARLCSADSLPHRTMPAGSWRHPCRPTSTRSATCRTTCPTW